VPDLPGIATTRHFPAISTNARAMRKARPCHRTEDTFFDSLSAESSRRCAQAPRPSVTGEHRY
jgi:hypothetical protein